LRGILSLPPTVLSFLAVLLFAIPHDEVSLFSASDDGLPYPSFVLLCHTPSVLLIGLAFFFVLCLLLPISATRSYPLFSFMPFFLSPLVFWCTPDVMGKILPLLSGALLIVFEIPIIFPDSFKKKGSHLFLLPCAWERNFFRDLPSFNDRVPPVPSPAFLPPSFVARLFFCRRFAAMGLTHLLEGPPLDNARPFFSGAASCSPFSFSWSLPLLHLPSPPQ